MIFRAGALELKRVNAAISFHVLFFLFRFTGDLFCSGGVLIPFSAIKITDLFLLLFAEELGLLQSSVLHLCRVDIAEGRRDGRGVAHTQSAHTQSAHTHTHDHLKLQINHTNLILSSSALQMVSLKGN